ncbi:hypothetical protein BC355_17630 [Vibrio cholerae]|uniref:Uncharacterized protein n=1 Tax=Vibrio cholerae TaxID=666 RepID=A0A395TE75_VIBCL|nr:hypothetical protein [Vibrio cholerae]EGR0468615.1 hypothetical protein [Vibrio cholerae]RGP82980.1 hypothetical protein BC355_17630 [Vibrio cholerae]RGP83320.1 hypothetical protein BC353_17590 [Vibrio cholerae]TXY52010.1 hypothetical protein FXE74_18625 [Vibrio cholerae]GIB31702.1 topoisomerase II [Vibrio cholerae]
MEQLLLFFDNIDSDTEFKGVWTDQEIIQIQEFMLFEALNEIRDGRKSEAMRTEAINWLMHESDEPFSADVCAANCGYDITTLRSYLRPILRKFYS